MRRKYLWAQLSAVAVLAAVLAAAADTGAVAPVADGEGARVRGGQDSGCANYGDSFVFCGSGPCSGQTKTCPTQNKLGNGVGVSAKDVIQYTGASCTVCGTVYCTEGTLSITGWEPCSPK